MMDHTKTTLHQLMNLQGYSELVRVRMNDQEEVVSKQKDVVYESAQKIVEVRKDLKKYEKLEEKLAERLSKEEEEKVKKQLDEIGIRNYSFDK
jgi:flagellar export protein FliJ